VPGADDWTKWIKFYGFVEGDMIYDTTESFNDVAGNAAIARKGTYAGDRARFTGGARNSRFGVKVSAPEFHGIKASGTFEMDFLGTQPAGTSEGTIFSSPLIRDRHLFLKLESAPIDVVVGQTWQLFGWQSYFQAASLQITGLPGQVVNRTPQVRLSHVFKTDEVNVELAVAATRPVQRDDAGLPDGAAGLRLLINRWKGLRTVGSTSTSVDAAGIGISGIARRVELPELTAMPHAAKKLGAYGLSVDALIPIIPRTAEDRSNALSLTGSFVTGRGIGDLYTGLTGGIPLPAPATPMGGTPIVYNATIDQGVIGLAGGKPKVISWQSFIIGLQYYTPIDNGHVWLALNYSNLRSPNAEDFSSDSLKTRIFDHSQFVNAALFWDATQQVRFGVDYAWYEQTYVDNVKAHNSRAQFSGFYIF
jgi:hypothetical protein